MKSASAKAPPRPASISTSERAKTILSALRDARKSAVKTAKMHNAPVVYLRAGVLVRERA